MSSSQARKSEPVPRGAFHEKRREYPAFFMERLTRAGQRRTCNAPGFTMLVGVPLMKFTTLSKADENRVS